MKFIKGAIFVLLFQYFWKKFWAIPIVDETAAAALDAFGSEFIPNWDTNPRVKKHRDDMAAARAAREEKRANG